MKIPSPGAFAEKQSSRLTGILRWWLEPRSTSRDEAFRERVIRSTLGIAIFFVLLSFSLSLVYGDAWAVISFPSVHVVVLVGLFASAFTISRQHLVQSGWLLVFSVLVGASGVIVLARQADDIMSLLVGGIPTFMVVPIIAAMILPRNLVVPTGMLTASAYALAQFGGPFGQPEAVNLPADQTIVSVFLFFLVESFLLRQLRVEFDARYETMRESTEQAERARREAEVARQRAEHADKAKTQFLANMSHELRTPLNAIIGYSEAMLGGMAGTFSDQQTKLLGHIQHNGHRLLSLINDVLDLSKIESGSLEVFLAPMSPHTTITRTVESLRSLADGNNTDLKISIEDALPQTLISDAKKVEQIVVNLVSNAIKFTSEGSVSVDIGPAGQDRWKIMVRDTGIGMPPDAAKYIFEPFRQVDSSSTRKHKGTGLGLAITKRLVDCLGGAIEVESQLGEGSTFTVTLPLKQPPAVADEKIPQGQATRVV